MSQVLHVSKITGVGGSERHLLALLPGLRARGVDARLLILEEAGRPMDAPAADFLEREVPVERIRIRGGFDPATVAGIRRRARGAGLVHSHLVHADTHVGAAVQTLRSPRPPHVVTVHSERTEEGSLARFAMCSVMRGCAACIAISEVTARTAGSLFGMTPDLISVVPYGVPVGHSRRDRKAAPDGVLVATHSRIVDTKRVDVVIKAMLLTDARLLVVGEGAALPGLRAEVDGLGLEDRVLFEGFREDVLEPLGEADIWVSMSEKEGFSLALAEALSVGLPVVCSDIPAHREVAGDAAIFVPPGSVEACAREISRLAADSELRGRMGAEARVAAARFSVDAMIDGTLNTYRSVLSLD